METPPKVSRKTFSKTFQQIASDFSPSEGGNNLWICPLVTCVLIGFVADIVYAIGHKDHLNAAASILVVSAAALAVGGFLGFLFGIPRVVQQPRAGAGASPAASSDYQVNTNLEEISDWLTKIIVGVGLVQIRPILHDFILLADYLAKAFGQTAAQPGFIAANLIYFGIVGFLLCYLWTRIQLPRNFSNADRAAKESPEFLEGIIQAVLYQPAPDGFGLALKYTDQYLSMFGEGNWRIWRSIACAQAQQFSYLSNTGKAQPVDLPSAKKACLDALKRTVALNKLELNGLRALWDPAVATPEENDLVVFHTDQDFIDFFAHPPV